MRARRLFAWLALLLVLLSAENATAKKPGDSRVRKLVTVAMEKHYLELEFREAEDKMKDALAICREDGCSTGLYARVYRYLAVIYALGLKDQDAAAFAFIDMLKLSSNLEPDKNFPGPEIDEAFTRARKEYANDAETERQAAAEREGKEAERVRKEEEEAERLRAAEAQAEEEQRLAESERKRVIEERKQKEREEREEADREKREPPPVAALYDEPWVEQALETPVPVYVELEEVPKGQKIKKVVVEYISPGGTRGSAQLRAHETGFGGYIPCSAVKEEGELRYWVTAIQEFDHPLATAGDENEPRIVFIKPALDHKQPALPGELPPDDCHAAPDDAASCETTSDCRGGDKCIGGRCTKHKRGPVAPGVPKNRFSLLIAPDFSLISSSGACATQAREDGAFSCFQKDGVEYTDEPLQNTNAAGSFSSVGPGTLRISLAYDRVFAENLTLGGRVGATLLGHPQRKDGKGVSPVHLEARGAWYFGKTPFAKPRSRVYAHAIVGYANAVGRISGVEVSPGGEAGLDVYQKGGPLVLGLGGGIEISIVDSGGLTLDLTLRQHLPLSLTTASPSIGWVYAL